MDDEVERVDEISSKTWDVMENKMIKAGLREGIGAGRDQVFQPSFDEGYKDGYEMGYNKGFLKGYLSVLSAEMSTEVCAGGTNVPSPLPCSLCVEDNHESLAERPISEIVKLLRENDQHYVDYLKSEHSAWMKKLGTDMTSTSSTTSKK